MEIWHRAWIDGRDVDYWRGRGLTMKPIRSAFYEDGTAKTWVSDVSESSDLWPEVKAYIGNRPHFVSTFFTDKERLAAEWCILRTPNAIQPREPVDGNWSSRYYETVCPNCGTGWKQIAPFQLTSEPRFGRNHFASFGAAYELLVVNEVVHAFESEGIRGVSSRLLLVRREGGAALSGRQLCAENVAAPGIAEELAEHEQFRSNDCSACGQKWHAFYTRGTLPVRRSALRSDVDFQMTHEWFGSGKAARREILVSQRVVKVILDRNWLGAEISPIRIV